MSNYALARSVLSRCYEGSVSTIQVMQSALYRDSSTIASWKPSCRSDGQTPEMRSGSQFKVLMCDSLR